MSQRYYLIPPGQEWPYDWCCRQWVTYINKGRKYRKDPRYIEIKYEDLLINPEKEIKRITDFLKIEEIPGNRLIKFYKRINIKKHPDHPDIAKPIDNKRINKWVSKMSEKDKRIFEKICGRTFRELGYKY